MYSWLSYNLYSQGTNRYWTVNLSSEYDVRSFGVPPHPSDRLSDRWKTQQGLVFVSNNILAVYQVVENVDAQTKLSPRDMSGGGGRYSLKIIFFLVDQNGKRLRDITLVTEGDSFSEVFSSGDGTFVTRTGNLLRLFSDNFEELKSFLLPNTHQTMHEGWLLASNPSNGFLVAKHEQDSGFGGMYKYDLFKIDLETLRLDTLDGGDLSVDRFVEHPSELWIHQLPSSLLGKGEGFFSAVGNQNYIAGEVRRFRYGPFGTGFEGKPARIVIYDLVKMAQTRAERLTEMVSFWPRTRLYAVSPQGALALIQKNQLSVWSQ
jgi:hypothetical protein